MDNFMNNFGNNPLANGSDGRPPGNNQLARQSSIYSLTFDEFQNTVGSLGRDYGSMNMDELLKNIWSAEENQNMVSATSSGTGNNGGAGTLQRQGSLTLPRTLSQRTVDEVWREISTEASGPGGGSNKPQRQQTLGEMTLEDFLVRAGVVREDTQMNVKPTNGANGGMFLTELSRSNNPTGLGIGFQQTGRGAGLMSNQANNDQISSIQAANLPLNVNGVRSNQTQMPQQHQNHHQPQIFPKKPVVSYASQLPLPNSNQLGGVGLKSGIMGLGSDHCFCNNGLVHGGGMGMVGLGNGPVTMATGSPPNLSSGTDTSSVSPVPCVFNGGLRGRKSNGVEKVVERRQRRMIKNRESAARSRARKQAYTMELEAEVQKLKEENQELRKKKAELMEMQKTQAMEMMNRQGPAKKWCLRRTQTGPW